MAPMSMIHRIMWEGILSKLQGVSKRVGVLFSYMTLKTSDEIMDFSLSMLCGF